jgi:hypothetical protein
MRGVALFFAVLLVGAPGLALALEDGGAMPAAPTDGAVPTEVQRDQYIEGWNDDQAYWPGHTYGVPCFGFAYVPGETYALKRIEFYAGAASGDVTVSLLENDGTGYPTGPILGTVTYVESATPGWQGADLVPSVPVTEGTQYYIYYEVVVGGHLSIAFSGVIIPYYYSEDCIDWAGPAGIYCWMARFYGQPQSPTEGTGWGAIKAMYR